MGPAVMRKLAIPEEPTRRLPPAAPDADFPTILGLMLDEELELPAAVRRPEQRSSAGIGPSLPVLEPELTLELDDTPPPVHALEPTRADAPRPSNPKTPVVGSSSKAPVMASSPKTPTVPPREPTPPRPVGVRGTTPPGASYALASIAPRRVSPPRAAAVPFPAPHVSSPAVRVARRSLPPATELEQALPPLPLPRARPAQVVIRYCSVFSGCSLLLRETEILLAWFLGVVAIIIGAAALRL
jgi:hypothetical protein